jgi:hypothetical protein
MAEEAMERKAVDSSRREGRGPKHNTALDFTVLGVTLAILAYCSWCADRPHTCVSFEAHVLGMAVGLPHSTANFHCSPAL